VRGRIWIFFFSFYFFFLFLCQSGLLRGGERRCLEASRRSDKSERRSRLRDYARKRYKKKRRQIKEGAMLKA
jgi:hypothetical protein